MLLFTSRGVENKLSCWISRELCPAILASIHREILKSWKDLVLFSFENFDNKLENLFCASLEKHKTRAFPPEDVDCRPARESDLSYRTPAGSSTCNRWRSVRAVKWSPDEADKPVADAGWCVSVDFAAGFLIFGDLNVFAFLCKSRDLAGNHGAWGVVWQPMRASVAALRILKRFYGAGRWWWMYTTLWGNIIKILPYASVSCVFGWTLIYLYIVSDF